MTLTYISCSSDFYTFYVNVPLSLGCIIQKVSAEDIAITGNGTSQEYMCPIRHFVYIFFNSVFQVSTAKNEISLFNNHILIVAPVTFAPAGAMTPSAEFLSRTTCILQFYTESEHICFILGCYGERQLKVILHSCFFFYKKCYMIQYIVYLSVLIHLYVKY